MDLFIKIYDALDTIHKEGIVHRDLKLSNILMDVDQPIITDFGLSRSIDATSITGRGTIIGSLDFMSPEQARGKKAGITSDLYSTGAMIWYLLLGKRIFEGRGGPLVHLRRISRDPIPQDIETLHPGIQYILRKLLSKNPQMRFQTARSVQGALYRFLKTGKAPQSFSKEDKVRNTRERPGKIRVTPRKQDTFGELDTTKERPWVSEKKRTRRLLSQRRARKNKSNHGMLILWITLILIFSILLYLGIRFF